MKMFSVRDLSSRFKLPTYDILFDDKLNGCVRCSFRIYVTFDAAQHEVDNLNMSQDKPFEWDKVLTIV